MVNDQKSKMNSEAQNQNYFYALSFLTTLFFLWGFMTAMNDILIPHLKSLFDMNYTQTMLIQFIFFGAYALMSIPSSMIIGRIGYKSGIVLGLVVAGLGALLFYPASTMISYPVFLFAFFTLASGITILQVAANPYVAILGSSETASSRLTLTQAFNSLGTYIAPLLGGMLILGGTYLSFSEEKSDHLFMPTENEVVEYSGVFLNGQTSMPENISNIVKDKIGGYWIDTPENLYRVESHGIKGYPPVETKINEDSKGLLVIGANENEIEHVKVINSENFSQFQDEKSSKVKGPYLIFALIFFLMAGVFVFARLPLISDAMPRQDMPGSAYQFRHLVLGAFGIFVYVGAEVSIGSFLINFFAENTIAGLSESEGAKFVALYWGSAMIGRFLGSISMGDIKNQIKRISLMVFISILGFIMAWYTTGRLDYAFVYIAFVALNVFAAFIGQKKPGRTLGVYAIFASILVFATTIFSGYAALWAIVVVGLFNSIMFPTIFTLAINGLGEYTSQGSGALNTAIVGGAILPLLMGVMADLIGIHLSFVLPAICYLYIAYYGFWGSVPRKRKV